MSDIIKSVCKYIDTREVYLITFLNKFSETDIVDDFIYNFDKLNFRYSHHINIVEIDSLQLVGCFDNYLKHMFKFSMHLLFNYSNPYGIEIIGMKIRRLRNIYSSDATNTVNCLNSIKIIIDHVIESNINLKNIVSSKCV